jgi:predicted flavoprotein YhiN
MIPPSSQHLIVIGGGAAGIFCAVNAARRHPGLNVTVLEKTGKLLSKVKVSGGGRCNVTHACYDITDMSKRYPRGGHFVRKAFYRWFTTDTIDWFRERGVELTTEEDGRMFPVTNTSQTIIDCLMKEVNRYGVEIRLQAEVKGVSGPAFGGGFGGQGAGAGRAGTEGAAGAGEPELAGEKGAADAEGADPGGGPGRPRFRVELTDGRLLDADYVCVACGGYPKSGMFDWIRGLGHSIEEPVPSLFTFNMKGDPITQLMGVSVPEVQVKITGSRLVEKGPLLITHWGFSGPVILRLSAWGSRELAAGGYRFGIQVNWIPAYSEQQARERLQELRQEAGSRQIGNGNPFGLPQRLWDYWLAQADIAGDVRRADLPAKAMHRLVSLLCAGTFTIEGKTTFKEEFVTAGGVKLSEVDAPTMESRKTPGLFFAGEILDVDGITGGFNFQHAWTSGWIAADTIAALANSARENGADGNGADGNGTDGFGTDGFGADGNGTDPITLGKP